MDVKTVANERLSARVPGMSPKPGRADDRRLFGKPRVGSHCELFGVFLPTSDNLDPVVVHDPLVDILINNRPERLSKE